MNEKQRNEYVEKKAKELIDKIEDIYPAFRSTTYWENFILSIIRDCQSQVSREFVERWNQTIAERVNVQMKKDFVREEIGLVYPGTENLTQMLKEAGLEVEEWKP